MTQRPLDFDAPPPPKPVERAWARSSDPATAHEAARSVKTQRLESIILARLTTLGDRGATSFELAESTTLDRITLSPRLRPMARKGLIIESPDRRAGPSGKDGIVWKINRETRNG